MPNLRFAVYGHAEYLQFLKNKDFSYTLTEEIRNDTLCEDIESEWIREEWRKGAQNHLKTDRDEDL